MSWTCPHCGAIHGCFGGRSPILTPPMQQDEKDKEIAKLQAENERLRAVISRLSSMEAFTQSRAVNGNNPADRELIARINFAERALKDKP